MTRAPTILARSTAASPVEPDAPLICAQPAAGEEAVVGGLVVAQQVAALVEAPAAGQGDHRLCGGDGPAGKAALIPIAAQRARAGQQPVGDHGVADREPLDLAAERRDHAAVLEPRAIGGRGHVLVLAAGHQQVDPAHRGAADLDEDLARAEGGGIGAGLLADLELMLDRVEGSLAELADEDLTAAVAHRESLTCPAQPSSSRSVALRNFPVEVRGISSRTT